MRHLLTLLLLAASAFGQTATISDTIRTPFGGTFSGTVTVSLNSPALAQPLYSGSITLSGWTQAVTVTAGVFTLTLYTNDLITPGGTSYTATYAPTSGSGWKETWIVPSGATTIREIRSTTVPSPSVRFTPSQITQAGATLGQGLKWDGSKWAPADVVANPMTTNGDLITRLGGVPVRVGIGSTNQVLTVSGGMPVWASGITGNASTASALAANGTNCSAGSFPLGVDASGNAEGCTAAVTASTGLSDSSALVRNNQANTYTAGNKQTFASSTTTAGAAFGGGITADPSSVSAGDLWYRADLGTFGYRNATAVDAMVAGGRALSTPGSVPFVTAAGVLGQSGNLFWDNANGRLGVGTNAPNNPLQVVSTATSAHSIFVSAPATNSAGSGFGFASNNGASTGLLQLDNSGNLVLRQAQSSMFFDFVSQLNFRANAGATQLMRLLSSGNLLLGTTTDDGTNRLQVAGNMRMAANTPKLIMRDTASGTADFEFQASGNILNINRAGVAVLGTIDYLNGSFTWHNQTPTTGSTSFVVRAGAGQGSNNLTTWQNSAGAQVAGVDSNSNIFTTTNFLVGGTNNLALGGSYAGLQMRNTIRIAWTGTGSYVDTPDLSLSRASANTLQVGDGGANANGTINAASASFSRATGAATVTTASGSADAYNTVQGNGAYINLYSILAAPYAGTQLNKSTNVNLWFTGLRGTDNYTWFTGSAYTSLASLSPGGTFTLYNEIPTTGSTSLVVRAGAGQTGNLFSVRNASNVEQFWVNAFGPEANNFIAVTRFRTNSNEVGIEATSGLDLASNRLIRYSSTTDYSATKDLSLSRASANTLQVGDGAANSNGTILARIYTWANGTEGTCDATLRGQVVMVQGGAGVADTFRVCRKDAANVYAWTALY